MRISIFILLFTFVHEVNSQAQTCDVFADCNYVGCQVPAENVGGNLYGCNQVAWQALIWANNGGNINWWYTYLNGPAPAYYCGKVINWYWYWCPLKCTTGCTAGQYNAPSNCACTACKAGYSCAGSVHLVQCTAGTYAGTGQSVCTQCPSGKYSTGVGATVASVCTDCQTGKYAPGTGSSVCTDCAAGSYGTGTGGATSVACTNCPAGTYHNILGANTSTACYAVQTCSSFADCVYTGCTTDAVEAYLYGCNGVASGGQMYAGGTWGVLNLNQPMLNNYCIRRNIITAGYPITDFTYCVKKLVTTTSLAPTTTPPPVTISLDGSCTSTSQCAYDGCAIANAGNIYTCNCQMGLVFTGSSWISQSLGGPFACNLCIKQVSGSTSLCGTPRKACTTGAQCTYTGCTASTSSTSNIYGCHGVSGGAFSWNGASWAGSTLNGGLENNYCATFTFGTSIRYCSPPTVVATTTAAACPTSCSAGGYPSSCSCVACSTGSYCSNGINNVTCATGTFASATASTVCTNCASGTFTSVTGQSVCTSCGTGTYGSTTGLTVCTRCGTGTYASALGLTVCTNCAPATSNQNTGSTTADACIPLTISVDGSCSLATQCAYDGCQIASNGNSYGCNCVGGFYWSGSSWVSQSLTTGFSCNTCLKTISGTTSTCGVPKQSCSVGTQCTYSGCTAPSTSTNNVYGCSGYTGQAYQWNGGSWVSTTSTLGGLDIGYCITYNYGVSSPTYCPRNPCPTACTQGLYAANCVCYACVIGSYCTGTVNATCSKGTFASSTGLSVCTSCSAGKFTSYDGSSICSDCPNGTYSTSIGATICSNCVVGTFSSASGSSVCTSCGAGTFSTTTGLSFCSMCPVGTFGSGTGSSTCTNCAGGYYTNVIGYQFCFSCFTGFYSNTGASTCLTCETGKYSTASAVSTCTSCPAGSFNRYTGSTNSNDCVYCNAGSYGSTTALSVCSACAVGEYSPYGGSTTCTKCSAGSYASEIGLSVCTSCAPGSISTSTGLTACNDCTIGKFASGTVCSDCAAGTYGSIGGLSACVNCAAGTVASATGLSACADCTPGSTAPLAGGSACIACTPGYFASSSGNSVCAPCGWGQYSTATEASTCSLCVSGTYSSLIGMTVCFNCPIGKFSENSGSMFESSCLYCYPGTYGSSTGLSACNNCSIGKYNGYYGYTQSSCFNCETGKYGVLTGLSVCTNCDVGTFQSGLGFTLCTECPVSSFAGTQGLTVCQSCVQGKYSTLTGLSVCTDCAEGKYTLELGSTFCNNCPLGYFTSSTGQSICQFCNSGTFTSYTGASICTQCPSGTFQTSVATTVCTNCQVGKYFSGYGAWLELFCSDCTRGTYGNMTGSSSCTLCELGKFMPFQGQTLCYLCPTSITVGQSACTSCVIGSYILNSICTSCPIGKFSNNVDPTYCTSCTVGSYSTGLGASVCVNCAAGTFTTSTTSECTSCAEGTFSTAIRATACVSCLAGSFSTELGTSQCISCTAGTFTTSTTSECTSCAEGTFSTAIRATACVSCLAGSFSTELGASQCISCTAGTFSENPGSTTCSPCAQGTYTASDGSTACIACPVGTFLSEIGATVCMLCAEGTYTENISSTSCASCPDGTYNTNLGSNSSFLCELCSAGTYSTAVGATTPVTCVSCPAGSSCPGGSVMNTCVAGTTFALAGQSTCTSCGNPCAATTYETQACTTTQNRVCTFCPPGSACPGGTSITSCIAASTFSLGNSSTCSSCTTCLAGTYETTTCTTTRNRVCTFCPPGSACPGGATITPCVAGTSFSLGNQSTCTGCTSPCSATTYQQQPCTTTQNRVCSTDCPPGYACPGGGTLIACTNGTNYSLATQTTCTTCTPVCTATTYQTQTCTTTQNRICMPCPAGSACPGGTTISLCVSGSTFALANQSACSTCTVCLAGTYETTPCTPTQNRVCTVCPTGSACPGGTAISACVNGTNYSLGNQSTCTPCDAVCASTTYETQACTTTQNRICTQCPAGSACPGGTVINACVAGTTFSLASQSLCSTCTVCSAGTYQTTPCTTTQNRVCTSCPAGSECPGGAFITSCILNTSYSLGNQSACTNCTVCAAGTFQTTACTTTQNRVCTSCPAGSACPGGAVITTCVNGSTFALASQSTCTACTVCLAGTYEITPCTTTQNRICSFCPAGSACSGGAAIAPCVAGTTFSLGNQSTCSSCTPVCAATTYELQTCTTTQNRVCSNSCPAGSACPGGAVLNACVSGTTFSLGNQSTCTNCTVCLATTYETTPCTTTQNRVCTACPPGSACPGGAAISTCVAGTTFSLGSQSSCTNCTVCLAGSYQTTPCTTTQNRVCTSCPAGSACPGGTIITPCVNGSNFSLASQSTCTSCISPCAATTYETQACTTTQNRICNVCPAGYACPGGTAITACANSTTFSLGSQSACTPCTVCGAGTTETSTCLVTKDRICSTSCPAGVACPGGATQTPCVNGTNFSPGNQSTCTGCSLCLAGNYESRACTTTQDRLCSACPAGSACTGSATITPCVAGSTFSKAGQAVCTGCSTPCAATTYETRVCNTTQDRLCSACPAGSACPGGATIAPCVTGSTFSLANQSSCSSCTVCLPGTYETVPCTTTQNRVCTPCPPGSACPGGATITTCVANSTFALANQSTCSNCTVCLPGSYQTTICTVSQNRICTPCPAGSACPGGTAVIPCVNSSTFSLGSQSSCNSCTICLAGTYEVTPCTTTQNRVCNTCNNGSTFSLGNQSACTNCSVCGKGKYRTKTCVTVQDTECVSCSAGKNLFVC
jgi:hypothetical protein